MGGGGRREAENKKQKKGKNKISSVNPMNQ